MGQKVEVLTKEQTACVLWPATEALLALTLPQSPESSSQREAGESGQLCSRGPRLSPDIPLKIPAAASLCHTAASHGSSLGGPPPAA